MKEARAAESGVEDAGVAAGTTCAQGVKFRAFQKGQEKASQSKSPFQSGGVYYNQNRFQAGGSVHINPAHKGMFTEQAHEAGYDNVQQFAHHVLGNKDDYNSATERIKSCRNARWWRARY